MRERMNSKILEKLYGNLERSKQTIKRVGTIALTCAGIGLAGHIGIGLDKSPERVASSGDNPSRLEVAKRTLAAAYFSKLMNTARATQPLLGIEKQVINGQEQNVTHLDGTEKPIFEVPEGASADTLETIAENGGLVETGDETLGVIPDVDRVGVNNGESVNVENEDLPLQTEIFGTLNAEQLKKLDELKKAIQKAAQETEPLQAARVMEARSELDQAYDEKLKRDLNAKLKP